MILLWLLPTVLAAAGLLAAVGMAFRAAEELQAFRRQLQYLAELRPALVEVGQAGHTLAVTLGNRRRT